MLDIKYWCALGWEIEQVRKEILVIVVSHFVMSSQAGPLKYGDMWTAIDKCLGRNTLIWGTGISKSPERDKAMATHPSILAWKISWTEEPGGLQSTGSLRVGHDWATSLSLFTFMHWSRKWQPTPVFLPGESQGQGSIVGCCLWGCTESDTTEMT